jgi:hypothetical protein
MKKMRRTRHITLAVIGSALMMTGMSGCDGSTKLYDKNGNVVPRSQWKTETGSWEELYDSEGHRMYDEDMDKATQNTYSSSTRSHGHGGVIFLGGGGGGSAAGRGAPATGGSTAHGGFGSTGGGASAAA